MTYRHHTIAILFIMLVNPIGYTQAKDYSAYNCLHTEQLYKLQLSEADQAQLSFFKKSKENLDKKIMRSQSTPILAETLYCLGALYSAVDNYKKAIEFFKKSKDLEKQNPLPFIALGETYEEIEKIPEALVNYERAVILDKSLILATFKAARLYYMQGEYNKALQLLRNSEVYQKEKMHFIRGLMLEGDIYSKLMNFKLASRLYLNSLSALNELGPWTTGTQPRFYPKELEIYKKVIESFCMSNRIDMVNKYYRQARERNIQANSLKTCLR